MSMPIAIVHASAAVLPRLTAEESFLASGRIAVGTGSLPEEDAKSLTAEWTRLTERATQAVQRRPSVMDLAAIGVGVVEVPRV